MANPDGVLDAIDACLEDHLSEDAMRWAPDEPDPTPPFRGVTAAHTFIDETGTALSAATAGWPVIRDDAADVLEWSTAIVLTIEPAVTRFTEAMEGMRRAAETALAGFGETFAPFLSATQASAHRALYSNDWKHHRRCPTCNPTGFPKPLAIDGHEYNRRRRRRNRR
jgi:hypothetical protein